MQAPPAGSNSSSSTSRPFDRLDFILLGILVLAAIPRLYLGATQFVEYDGYWHIFAAQQDRWRNFVWDCRNLAHPPLYYLLLRWTLWLGTSHLAYRAIPLVAGLGSVVVLGRIASKAMRSTLTPPLVALAYALALPAIIVACEVRAYMLCSCLLLIAYTFFLDTIGTEEPSASVRPRVYFAVSAALACLTEYYAVFFLAAVFGISMLLTVFRRREPLLKAWAREAATFAPAGAAMVWLYFVQFSKQVVVQAHLLPFYYDPKGEESRGQFLLRTLQRTFDLFSPWPAPSRSAFLAIAGGLLLAVCGTLWVVRRVGEPKNLAAGVTVLITVAVLAQLMVASVLRLYPFGGFLRQQFVLFPLLILCAFFLPDRLATAIPRGAAYALAGVLALAIAAVGYSNFKAYPKVAEKLMTARMRRFDRQFPAPEAVYLDQYNVIAFFLHHDDWKWKFLGRMTTVPGVDIYRVSRGTRQMLVFRDKGRWIANCLDPAFDHSVAECLRSRPLHAITVFRLDHDEEPWERDALKVNRQSIAQVATSQGLCVDELLIHNHDVFEELHDGECTAALPR